MGGASPIFRVQGTPDLPAMDSGFTATEQLYEDAYRNQRGDCEPSDHRCRCHWRGKGRTEVPTAPVQHIRFVKKPMERGK